MKSPWEDFADVREIRVGTHDGEYCLLAQGPHGYMFRRVSILPGPVELARAEEAARFLTDALAQGCTIAADHWRCCGVAEGSSAEAEYMALAAKLQKIAAELNADVALARMPVAGGTC